MERKHRPEQEGRTARRGQEIPDGKMEMEAIKQLIENFPDAKIYGKLPEGTEPEQGQAGQEKGKDFQYGADAFEAQQTKDKTEPDNMEPVQCGRQGRSQKAAR